MNPTAPDGPGVRIDPSALRWVGSVWPGCFLSFTPSGAFDFDALMPSVRAAADSIGYAKEGEGSIGVPAIIEGAGMMHLWMHYGATKKASVRRWAILLADRMTKKGLSGLLHRQRPVYNPEWVSAAKVSAPAVSVLYASRRSLDNASTHQLARGHALVRLPNHSLSLGSRFQAPVAYTDNLLAALPGLMSVSLTGWDEETRSVSSIHVSEFWSSGWTYQGDRGEQVDRARAALTALAPDVDHAFAEVTTGLGGWNRTLHQPADGIDGTAYVQRRDLWPQRVIDAHGLQVLTAGHLARAHDLSDWRTHKVEDRYLVEARDLDAWYTADEPDPQMLEKARADFGAMILTRAQLDAIRAAEREASIREYQERVARGETT